MNLLILMESVNFFYCWQFLLGSTLIWDIYCFFSGMSVTSFSLSATCQITCTVEFLFNVAANTVFTRYRVCVFFFSLTYPIYVVKSNLLSLLRRHWTHIQSSKHIKVSIKVFFFCRPDVMKVSNESGVRLQNRLKSCRSTQYFEASSFSCVSDVRWRGAKRVHWRRVNFFFWRLNSSTFSRRMLLKPTHSFRKTHMRRTMRELCKMLTLYCTN